MLKNKLEEKNKTLIFIFISKITQKNMQDLIYFLQKNNFNFKRVTKTLKKNVSTERIFNSNFVLESRCELHKKELQNLIFFLKQSAIINNIFFQNQFLNEERIFNLKTDFGSDLWKKLQNQKF